ncbi:MAG: ParA family protein [Leptospiraceae bacterium]|nr:ParA family protein [Leptospiraceae bacterium]
MIISFVQTKGGTGKSTLAMNISFSEIIKNSFGTIALVELDPQGTLRSWWQEREETNRPEQNVSFHHISSTQKEVIQEGIKSIATHNELLILDIPGESVGKLHTKFACAISDLVIIPMRTSTNDESAFATNLLPIIREIVKSYPDKIGNFCVLPSYVHSQANRQKIINYFRDILPEYVKCLPTIYPFRAIYENFNRDGMNIYEFIESIKKNKKLNLIANKTINDIEDIAKVLLDQKKAQN